MWIDRSAPYVGVAACLAVLLALAAPFVLLSQPGTGLTLYYNAGPFGAAGVAFLAIVGPVIFLSGERGAADPDLASGVTLAVGIALFALTILWAVNVDRGNVLSFSAAWMGWHRWLVVGLAGVVAASAVAYARDVL